MCKNSENGAKLPISRKSTWATHAGIRNDLRSEFTSSPVLAGVTTVARANRARAWVVARSL